MTEPRKFNRGDRVRVRYLSECSELSWDEEQLEFQGKEGIMVDDCPDCPKVQFPEGTILDFSHKKLQPSVKNNYIKPTTNIMTKLTSAFKKFLSPSLKAQVEAGFRGPDLELTSSGNSILLEIIAEKFEEEFTAKAKELIKESKEANK